MPFTTKKTQTLNLFYFFLSNVLCFFSYSLPAYHSNCGFLIPHTCNGLIYPLDGAFHLRVRWLASAHTSSRVSRIPSLLAGCRGQNRRTEGGDGGAEGQLQLEFFFWCFFSKTCIGSTSSAPLLRSPPVEELLHLPHHHFFSTSQAEVSTFAGRSIIVGVAVSDK